MVLIKKKKVGHKKVAAKKIKVDRKCMKWREGGRFPYSNFKCIIVKFAALKNSFASFPTNSLQAANQIEFFI